MNYLVKFIDMIQLELPALNRTKWILESYPGSNLFIAGASHARKLLAGSASGFRRALQIAK